MLFYAWHQLLVFPCLAPIACFSTLGSGYILAALGTTELHVFPRWVLVTFKLPLAQVACFPALCIGYLFSRAWPRLCFPALGTDCVFSRAWPQMRAFPSLAPVTSFPPLAATASFPALDTDCNIFFALATLLPPQVSHPWQWLHVFQRMPPISCFIFPVLGTNRMFHTLLLFRIVEHSKFMLTIFFFENHKNS